MATETQGNNISRVAAADLSAKQNFIVKTDANGKIVLAAAATDVILGTLRNAPGNNDTADVNAINGAGTGKVKVGAAVAKDAYLTTDANGKAIATTTAGNKVFGIALEAASAANQVIEYLKFDHVL
jgi:hypothetical protein